MYAWVSQVACLTQVSPPKPCRRLSPIRATCPAHPIILDFITRTILVEQYRSYILIYLYFSDNLNFGVQFARKFVDAPEKVKPSAETKNKKAWSVRTKMNLHNNEAGRQVSALCHFYVDMHYTF